MKNAAIYIRAKTDLSENSFNAISLQLRQCKAYADANGLNIVGLYSDIILFGTTPNFVGWNSILNNPAPSFDCVLASEFCRLGRNFRSVIADIKKLRTRGVEIIFATNTKHEQLRFKEFFKL